MTSNSTLNKQTSFCEFVIRVQVTETMAGDAVAAVASGNKDFDEWLGRVNKQFTRPLRPGVGSQRIMNLLRVWECVYPSAAVVTYFLRDLQKEDLIRVWEYAQEEYGPDITPIATGINAVGPIEVGFSYFNSHLVRDMKTGEETLKPRIPTRKHGYGGDPERLGPSSAFYSLKS